MFQFEFIIYIFLADIDECLCNPCGANGQCVNEVNKYTCTCDAGWTGTNCDEGKGYIFVFCSTNDELHEHIIILLLNSPCRYFATFPSSKYAFVIEIPVG